ncbi:MULTISPECIES: GNAT family N-acetyltransferase [Lysinibacillus]|uniref:GNAT family N-acetyltransferase n=2 Tax=Bacillaceae TaxID=186817 RepID=A0ABY8KCF7_9BACI|nr:GNAT family N-acetyltransferase [Lysinibacillus capsici]MCT1726951.1 GNAT family N-acetyltransferase [Lysinibacillus capsici]WGF36656.1 GNAT family N-acetyltransferase [Lysinibacillus capsici]
MDIQEMGITMTKKIEKKYIPLANYFDVALQQEITLSFGELENIMGQALPNAAYLNKSWWKKTKPPLSHYLSWTNAGYYVIDVKLGSSVSFSRTQMKSTENNTSNSEENSSAYIIRGIEASDARSFIHLQEEIFQETDFMYNVQNELDLTVQQLRKNLTYWKQLKNRTILLCVLNGIFAGYAVIHGYKQSKARHVASIRLAVKEEYQQKGIGSALMKAVESWSKQHDISRLELSVMEHNNVALHLFTKLGFHQEGIRKNAIKLNDTYINEYNLSKIL